MTAIETVLAECALQTEQAMAGFLPSPASGVTRLNEAMHYSVFAGGKRLRPALVLLTARACGGDETRVLPAACAMEFIHTYSLIHDDLPAMDNDDYRRGKLTNHKVFGEATAILAGDALLTLAFETVAAAALPPAAIADLVRELARAAGALGMVGGQMADLLAQGKALTEAELRAVHARKTGALLTASVVIGARAMELSADKLDHLRAYGDCIGLAFQIVDDILDVAGDATVLGKATGGDVAAGKATYPGLLGLDESRRRAAELVAQAQRWVQQAQLPHGHYLEQLAAYIVARDH